MTTVAQVRQVVQPLLQRNSDLALVGRLVVIKPVQHILRGVYIDRMSDPLIFRPIWAVVFLFEPRQTFSFNWGERVYRRPGSWDVSDPDTPATMAAAIEEQALPLLRPVQSIDEFVRFTTSDRFPYTPLDFYELRKIFVDVARGDLDAARSICEFLMTDRGKRKHLPLMQEEYDRITQRLCPLVAANDRPGLARLLHEFEARSAKDMKLDKIWEATPFPIELL
jgi:hypothetical protein